jgi:2-dehydro-3-deoxy-D-arabinonate dehydratase
VNGLYRVALPGGGVRWARGDVWDGPRDLLPPEFSLDRALGKGRDHALRAFQGPAIEPAPAGIGVLAPVESQEIWAAGVTYRRSRDARLEESGGQSAYDLAYEAARPELFFKSPAWRVRATGQSVGVRRDSSWNVPEPELALVLSADFAIVGYTLGNDVSSREIEGANTLYLPQAKVYDQSCALGPCIVPVGAATPPFEIELRVRRGGAEIFRGSASTAQLKRGFDDLAAWMGLALDQPAGMVLLTGTGTVPAPPFDLIEGDEVTIACPELGALVNEVVAVGRPAPQSGPPA